MRFLAQYVQTLDAPPPFVTALGLTATQLEVEQWVFTEKRKPPPDGRGPGGDQDKEAGERSELEKIVQDLYEIRGAGMEERWATVVKRPTARLILLGAPGQGKTFSTKATVLKIAAAALADIHSFRCQPDAVPVAVWVKAAVWASVWRGPWMWRTDRKCGPITTSAPSYRMGPWDATTSCGRVTNC